MLCRDLAVSPTAYPRGTSISRGVFFLALAPMVLRWRCPPERNQIDRNRIGIMILPGTRGCIDAETDDSADQDIPGHRRTAGGAQFGPDEDLRWLESTFRNRHKELILAPDLERAGGDARESVGSAHIRAWRFPIQSEFVRLCCGSR